MNQHSSSDSSAIIWNQPGQIVYLNNRDPLGGKSLEEIVSNLKLILDARVVEAFIFGSFATGQFHKDSDLDLLLVVDTNREFLDRFLDFRDILDIAPRVDLLVYTPEEWKKIQVEEQLGFWKSLTSSLRKIV